MHKATFKKCPDYEFNWMLKKTMAEENVSVYEAREILKENLGQSESLDILRTREFPELRRREPELLGYKDREGEDNIFKKKESKLCRLS